MKKFNLPQQTRLFLLMCLLITSKLEFSNIPVLFNYNKKIEKKKF